jgi:hypothetical protein
MTLEEMVAREEIRELRTAYSTAFDSMDEAAVRANFSKHIECIYPPSYGGTHVGTDAILDLFKPIWAASHGPFGTLHVIANHSIEITGPDTATGHCILLDYITRQEPGDAVTTLGGHENPLLLIGRYEDEYVREDGNWKFRRIELKVLWPERA